MRARWCGEWIFNRGAVVAAAALLGACASAPPASGPTPGPGPAAVETQGTWTFAFDAGPGIASAVLSSGDGKPMIKITCQAPRGDLEITDWSFARDRQGPAEAEMRVGSASKQIQALIAGTGDNRQALTAKISPVDPLFRALTPNADVRIIVGGGPPHIWAPGAASRINDVINSCRTLGS